MCSADSYNKIANDNTVQRAKLSDWKTYAASIKEEAAKITSAPKPDDKHHCCMIIGYNETTQEVAVSDSWGPQFERRWVPLAVADWASMGSLFMILP